ncbi:hypothetical protein EBZ80_08820 [bacterium]|nr:hypothetical protein [bacterium]
MIKQTMRFISEEQKEIVLDPSRVRKICGCAGSRKTDTMIKCGIRYLRENRSGSCLFLTLVGSVTDEIRRRLSAALRVPIDREGMSNHYVGRLGGATVEVANFDAFVHTQLGPLAEDIAGDFEAKARLLLERIRGGEHRDFLLRDGTRAGMVLVDEFQDFSPVRVDIVADYFRRDTTTARLVVLGDMMQTIFSRALDDHTHPLIRIDALRPATFRLSRCYRCPAAHIETVNILTSAMRSRYDIPPMVSDATGPRPLFFTHDATMSFQGAYHTAQTVLRMIEALRAHDQSVTTGDIVILMKRCNHQSVFNRLAVMLRQRGEEFYVAETRNCLNEHHAIDWERARDRLVMLSIHGDKGKGHPVVFFLGFSAGSIPEERHLLQTEELLSQSLMNVAMTRSTRYLFVGMSRSAPSVYFRRCARELASVASMAWRPETIDDGVLAAVARAAGTDAPFLGAVEERKVPLAVPVRSIISVQQEDKDVWRDPLRDIAAPRREILGTPVRLRLDDGRARILRSLVRLLFARIVRPALLLKILRPFRLSHPIVFTTDDQLLSVVKDHRLNRMIEDTEYWKTTTRRIGLSERFPEPRLIVHAVFERIQRSLEAVADAARPCDPADLWLVALFCLEYLENQDNHSLLLYHGSPPDGIPGIEANLRAYAARLAAPKRLLFQQKAALMGVIDDAERLEGLGFRRTLEPDKRIFVEGYRFGINATIDFVDPDANLLIDLRFSAQNECRPEWLAQAITGSLLSRNSRYANARHIHIYNVTRGVLYTTIRRKAHTIRGWILPILESYRFPDVLRVELEAQIRDEK